MKKATNQNNILDFVKDLHSAADQFQRKGFKPKDLINIYVNANEEVEVLKGLDLDIVNFDTMTWGEVCNFIIKNESFYKDYLELLSNQQSTTSLH